jgi:hypothetical protein
VFFRWYGYGLDAEREEALSEDPEANDAWARAFEKDSLPAQSWEQERWDIETVPSSLGSGLISDTSNLSMERDVHFEAGI